MPLVRHHLPDCRVVTFAEAFPDGEKPEGMTEAHWNEIGVQKCAPGCPRATERRRLAMQRARERGWLTDEGWDWDRSA
jgi:hypothetical protein